MSANEHMKQADSNMAYSDSVYADGDELSAVWMQRAQVEATLALAYEQRTTNLIAMYLEGPHTISVDRGALGEKIKERLDLA